MSEVNVQLKEGAQAAVQLPAGVSVSEALKRLDRDAARQALAAEVDGREVDLAYKLERTGTNGDDAATIHFEPVLPATRDGLGVPYERIEGEAAFYGPKIDFKIEDATGRLWQLGTVQWDFNLPERFELEYAFPLWLAPLRVSVLPITDRINEYAQSVAREVREAGLRVEVNTRSEKVGAKIRDAQLQKVPFMLVLGDREMEQGNVAVRERTTGDLGSMSTEDFKLLARRLVESRALTNT